MSELHPSPAGEQDRGHDLRDQCLPAAVYHQRGNSWGGATEMRVLTICSTPSDTFRLALAHPGGQHEQRAGAGQRRGALPVRPPPQLHGGGDGERRAVRRHRHRLLRPRPRHLPQPRGDAAAEDGAVQLQVAQW